MTEQEIKAAIQSRLDATGTTLTVEQVTALVSKIMIAGVGALALIGANAIDAERNGVEFSPSADLDKHLPTKH